MKDFRASTLQPKLIAHQFPYIWATKKDLKKGNRFDSEAEVEKAVKEFLEQQPQELFKHGIHP